MFGRKKGFLQVQLKSIGILVAPRLRQWKTLDEVPSAPEGKWVAFIRHAQAGHNVARLEKAGVLPPGQKDSSRSTHCRAYDIMIHHAFLLVTVIASPF